MVVEEAQHEVKAITKRVVQYAMDVLDNNSWKHFRSRKLKAFIHSFIMETSQRV
jgi:hypothetical protein